MTDDSTAAAVRAIIDADYGLRTHKNTTPLRVLTGVDSIEFDAYPRGNVITVSRGKVKFWKRVSPDRGPCTIYAQTIDGLASFMSKVMWPHLAPEWNQERLMADGGWTEIERAAIDAWEFAKARLRRLIHRDHLKNMAPYSAVRDFYLAVYGNEVAALRRHAAERRGQVAQIDRERIQVLIQAIEVGDRALTLSQKASLIFEAALIAAAEDNNYPIMSDEQVDALSETADLSMAVYRLAQQRYTAQFQAFCLSEDMLAVQERHFSGMPEGGRASYIALMRNGFNRDANDAEV